MLTALGKWIELGTHVRGAVRNGASEVEIREALLQARYVCYWSEEFGLSQLMLMVGLVQCLLRHAGWIGSFPCC